MVGAISSDAIRLFVHPSVPHSGADLAGILGTQGRIQEAWLGTTDGEG